MHRPRQPLVARTDIVAVGILFMGVLTPAAHGTPLYTPGLLGSSGLTPVCVASKVSATDANPDIPLGVFLYKHDGSFAAPPQTCAGNPQESCVVRGTPTPFGMDSNTHQPLAVTELYYCRAVYKPRHDIRVVLMIVDDGGKVVSAVASRRDEGIP